jgi:hypothetical protein
MNEMFCFAQRDKLTENFCWVVLGLTLSLKMPNFAFEFLCVLNISMRKFCCSRVVFGNCANPECERNMISEVVLFIMPDGQWQSLTDVPPTSIATTAGPFIKANVYKAICPAGSSGKTLPPPPDVKLVPLI